MASGPTARPILRPPEPAFEQRLGEQVGQRSAAPEAGDEPQPGDAGQQRFPGQQELGDGGNQRNRDTAQHDDRHVAGHAVQAPVADHRHRSDYRRDPGPDQQRGKDGDPAGPQPVVHGHR